MKRLYTILSILISLCAYAQKDSLCANDKGDYLTSHVFNSYRDFVTLPEQKVPQYFGCGSAAYAFEIEITCKKLDLLLEKYPFLFVDIRSLEKEDAKFKYLDVFWIQNNEHDNERLSFALNEDDEEKYSKWKLKNQYKLITVAVIVDKTDENTEYVQLKILFPREKREIIKEYKLYKSREKWQYETFYPKLTS